MIEPTCSNCYMREMPDCGEHGVCENWDGGCQICNLAGEPFLREYCGDCDLEEDEDDG